MLDTSKTKNLINQLPSTQPQEQKEKREKTQEKDTEPQSPFSFDSFQNGRITGAVMALFGQYCHTERAEKNLIAALNLASTFDGNPKDYSATDHIIFSNAVRGYAARIQTDEEDPVHYKVLSFSCLPEAVRNAMAGAQKVWKAHM